MTEHQTMRAAFAPGPGQPLEVREVPVPVPGPGQLLVRLAASGVCHTDLSLIDGEWLMKKPRYPFIPGHEAAGHVAQVGPGVTAFQEKDRVGVFWLNSVCGTCEDCVTGAEQLCLRQVNTGYTAGGTYAEYCVVSASHAIPLPQGPLELLAPVMCAGVTSYKAVKDLGLAPGSWVVISGLGGTGHLAVQYARAMGLRVAAIDVEAEKVEQARALGAELAFNAEHEFPVNQVIRRTGGVRGAVVTAGSAKALEQGLRMLARGGTLMVVGVPAEPLPIPVLDLVVKKLTMRGTIIGNRQDVREALELVAAGKVTPAIESRRLDEINDAITAIRERRAKGRFVLRMA